MCTQQLLGANIKLQSTMLELKMTKRHVSWKSIRYLWFSERESKQVSHEFK